MLHREPPQRSRNQKPLNYEIETTNVFAQRNTITDVEIKSLSIMRLKLDERRITIKVIDR